jgi:peroxiredoxin
VLRVDANGDGDLTNDPAIKLEGREQTAKNPQTGEVMTRVVYQGEATVNARYQTGKPEPVRMGIYHFVFKNGPGDSPLKDTILYYREYAREGEIDLGGKKLKVLLMDEQTNGRFDQAAHPEGTPPRVQLLIDRDGDGAFDPRYELYDLSQPFNIGGVTYEVGKITPSGAQLTLKPSEQQVAEVPIPPSLKVGQPALAFSTKDMDGKTLEFPRAYAGKLVLLDFWATWCPPCREEIPHLVKAYGKFHGKGLEILGISLDRPNQGDEVRKFLADNKMTWKQVYDPMADDSAIANQYFIESIPSAFLIDGSTGKILATGQELRGEELEATLTKALAARGQ